MEFRFLIVAVECQAETKSLHYLGLGCIYALEQSKFLF